MNLDERLDLSRYSSHIFWLLVSATAARFSTEDGLVDAISGFVMWTFAFFMCLSFRPSIHAGKDAAKKVENAGNLVAGVGLLITFLTFQVDGLLPALLTLLFSMLAALFLIAEKRVHLWLLLAAAFVAVIFAASESRSPLFLFWVAWFTIAALGLITFDYALNRESQMVARPVDVAGTSRGGTAVALITLAIALPLYLFVPTPPGLKIGGMTAKTAHDYREIEGADKNSKGKTGSGAASRQGTDAGMVSGIPLYEDDFGIEQVQRDSELADDIVMFVKSSYPVNLRGKVFDRFENNRWYRDRTGRRNRELIRGQYEPPERADDSTPIAQIVEVQATLDESLYSAPGVSRLRFPGPVLYEYDDGTLDVPRPLRADTTYSVESRLDISAGRYLLPQKDLGDRQRERYLQLPENLSVRIKQLAEKVSAGRLDSREMALSLEKHLRENYEYSFETALSSQGVTPLDWFLFEGKRGHCEFFASSLVVMLRSVGIPARLATGFSLGETNPLTGFHEVRALDGHAWVEAYLPGRGWMMLEPTPFYAYPSGEEPREVAGKLDRYLDRWAQTSQALTPGSVKTAVVTALNDLWRRLRHTLRRLIEGIGALGWWLPILAVAVGFLILGGRLAVLGIQDMSETREIRQLLRAATSPDSGQEGVLCAAEALEVCLAARDAERPIGATFREYYETLRKWKIELRPEFVDQFEENRYGSGPFGTASVDLPIIRVLVDTQMSVRPYPRVSRQLAAWREMLTDWPRPDSL